jgi:RNA 3'-terminal phosphate cyclase (ATP)
MPQHLAAVRAAAEIGDARVEGASVGSQDLRFMPRQISAGEYRFDIGTAGSTGLVLQTVLPALLRAKQSSRLTLIGGTHNPLAPSFEFLQQAFLPLINRMGPSVEVALERPGFYPAGGGVVHVAIEPSDQLHPLYLIERGPLAAIRAEVLLSQLPEHIAQRELRILAKVLTMSEGQQIIHQISHARGPGNAVTVSVASEHITEVFTGFGVRGVRAETVAQRLAGEVQHYLRTGVAVGEHMADQLLLPMALAGAGAMLTVQPSLHTQTNLEVLQQFLPLRVKIEEQTRERWLIALSAGYSVSHIS